MGQCNVYTGQERSYVTALTPSRSSAPERVGSRGSKRGRLLWRQLTLQLAYERRVLRVLLVQKSNQRWRGSPERSRHAFVEVWHFGRIL